MSELMAFCISYFRRHYGAMSSWQLCCYWCHISGLQLLLNFLWKDLKRIMCF